MVENLGTWQNMGQYGEILGNIGENGELSTLQNAGKPGLVSLKRNLNTKWKNQINRISVAVKDVRQSYFTHVV